MSGAVTWERPPHGRVLRELVGRVGHTPDHAFERLHARVAPQLSDSATRRAVVQGGYWYRAEYAVEPDGAGSRVTCTLVNVAPGSQLVGRLTGRSVLRAAPRIFQQLLSEL